MLIDDVKITVKAGDGGNGAVTFHPMRGGPSGGNGGKGGNIYLIGVNAIDALYQFKFKKKLTAENGENGGKQDKDGKNADDLYIKVPIGTRVSVNDSDWIWETEDDQTPFLLAKGGRGGLGNDEFKSATNQTPQYAEKGQLGQMKKVHLQMRLIANIGLIGLPNAGKSSLLQSLTKANPKIGDYPFTTLEPNLGVMPAFARQSLGDGGPNKNLILADIPGLIEGASTGRGLGIKFLKHIEKTSLLAHCIDISQEDLNQPYETVRKEFEQYNPELLNKPEIIILTKTDLLDKNQIEEKIKAFKSCHPERSEGSPPPTIIPVSIIDDQSLENLKKILTA